MKTAIFVLFAVLTSYAEDTLPSSTPPWRCYTGIRDDDHANASVSVDYEMYLSTLDARMPQIRDDNRKPLATVRWIGIPADVKVTQEHIATYHGHQIWRVTYRSTNPDQLVGHVEAAVFLLTTQSGLVRPVFVICPDESESFHSFIESSSAAPFVLSADTHMSGTGAYHSSYRFSFEKAVPHFLGRTDSGRRMEPKTYR